MSEKRPTDAEVSRMIREARGEPEPPEPSKEAQLDVLADEWEKHMDRFQVEGTLTGRLKTLEAEQEYRRRYEREVAARNQEASRRKLARERYLEREIEARRQPWPFNRD